MSDATNESMDALLSADLDGETTSAEHNRIAADPELRARQEELRSASGLAGRTPPPLDAAMVADSITRALSELPATDTGPLTVHSRPSGSTGARARSVRWLVAAVVLLLAGTGIGLIVTAKSPSQRADTTTGGAARHAETTTVPATSVPTAAGAARLAFLGDFASPESLRSALAAKVPSARSEALASRAPALFAGQADRCATVIEARNPELLRPNRQTVVAATIAGKPVVVLEYRTKAVKAGARQTTRVIALGRAACDERLDFER